MKNVLIPTSLVAAIALAGCSAVEPGTAKVELNVSAKTANTAQARSLVQPMLARSTETPAAALTVAVLNGEQANGEIQFTTARLVIEEIELDSDRDVEVATGATKSNEDDDQDDDQDEENELELAFAGPIIADLVNETLSPNIDTAEIKAGMYQELEVDIDPVTEVDWAKLGDAIAADDVLRQGYSVHLAGTYTAADSNSYEITVLLDSDFEKEQPLANDLVLTADSVTELSIAFDLTGLFNDIDLASLVGAGSIVIDSKGTNSDVADVIAERIDDALELAEE